MSLKKILIIFSIAFILNLVWENLHSFLYTSYQGGKITEYILLRASLFDAFLITLILLPFLFISFFKKRPWLIIFIGIVIAVINEWYGLATGRWAYAAIMPTIPFVNVGITPALQLGVLGFVTYRLHARTEVTM